MRLWTIAPLALTDNPRWTEFSAGDGVRGFVDESSVRVEAGEVRYIGKLDYDETQPDGARELVFSIQMHCATHDYTLLAIDKFGPDGERFDSFLADELRQPWEPDSPGQELYAKYCA